MHGLVKHLQGYIGILSVLSGLLTAVSALNENLRKFLGIFTSWNPAYYWFAAGALIVVGLTLFWNARQKTSKLLNPEALRLSPRDSDHLVGREEDIERLEKTCLNHPLVFLVGESGSGKSALIQAGLVPRLNNEGRFLSLYIDMSDLDRVKGPLHVIADTFWRRLHPDQREALGFDVPPKPQELNEHLRHCYVRIGATPMLIFDQFDDFQSRHRDRFLIDETHTWVEPGELRKHSIFFDTVANWIADRAVHSVFITRSDSADGLDCVRFSPGPRSYHLDRLEPGFARQLLDRLSPRSINGAPGISDPERGWTRLSDRIVRDLELTAVLPQQPALSRCQQVEMHIEI